MDQKIQKILEASKEVIRSCSLENGALVAANPMKEYYSAEAKHYFYVWPRDGAFTCIAASMIGITDIQEKFFDWIEKRAEDMDNDGFLCDTCLLYEKYYINGPQALHRFQPDQAGALLWAISIWFKENPKNLAKYEKLIERLADGLSHFWGKDHFKTITNDLWEERQTYPDLKDNFTYALAACGRGLISAGELLHQDKWVKTGQEMKKLLKDSASGTGFFYRSFGRLDDKRTDASLLGLIWPFDMIEPDHPYAKKTVEQILEKIVIDNGLYRYEHDEYDGWMYRGNHRKKGAGYWPLLNFWLAIVLNRMGRKDEAMKYYQKAIDDIDGKTGLIAEQVFNNDIQKAVSPLCWSHAMFIFASKELGII